MTSILIIGRRWFERHNGNTYNTAEIFIDGKFVHKTDFAYGYDSMFEQIAVDWLEANGHMPGREHAANGSKTPGWRYFRDERGIEYRAEAIDVQRKKDL